ncbi:hypothetical protein [Pseudomonas viciae]|nr:hypothetical protein [Pseudomonas viciae]
MKFSENGREEEAIELMEIAASFQEVVDRFGCYANDVMNGRIKQAAEEHG